MKHIDPIRRAAAFTFALALMGASLPAAAVDEYALRYSKHELTTQQGVADVHARILKAAREYCPSYSLVRDLRRVRTCKEAVADDLVSRVAHPRLTSYHMNGSDVRLAAAEAAAGDNS